MTEFSTWLDLARDRAIVRLMDGREAELMAVRRNARSCKIRCGGRHYNCWIDDIALVRRVGDETWMYLDAWPIVNLENKPGTKVTPLEVARRSPSWLHVVPNPAALHPSFHRRLPPLPRVAPPPPVAQHA